MPRSVMKERVPLVRVSCTNEAGLNPQGRFVLYWMTAFRRTTWNYALERAAELASRIRKPLLIVETLRSGVRWASDRHHTFVLQGMVDNRAACEARNVRYYPFVEFQPGDAIELVTAMAADACAVVTDDLPIESVASDASQVGGRISVRMDRVDANGLLPMWATDRVFLTAYAFRRFLQRTLPDHLLDASKANPLARLDLPRLRGPSKEITRRWPPASSKLLAADVAALARLPIDHEVGPVDTVGGPSVARKKLREFLRQKLSSYPESRNQPDADSTSGLSPYLHFGHISVHEIFRELAKAEGWSPANLSDKATGKRQGWWGMSEAGEAFIDQLVTWREVGLNMCCHSGNYDKYDSLPDWAKATLAEHATDRRQYVYSLEEFELRRTHDALWNAAQMQLVREGHIHNYLRMLWGKKILQWSASPRDALDVMIELNNKYALDGRDPNSYSGIFWVLGRYDRPWGPQRPIFGKVRYMSSENTARKLKLRQYMEHYGSQER